MLDAKQQAKSKLFINMTKKKRKYKNIFLYSFIVIFTVGYGLFFTSKSWFPGKDELIMVTKIDKVNTWENREVVLVNWEYSPVQHMMEIQIDIKNKAYDGIDKYKFSAIDRKEGYLDVETVVDNSDYVVIRIKNLKPGWSEISFRMAIPNDKNASLLKLYTNKYDVARVEKITDKTENEYRMARLQSTIDMYQKYITDLKGEIADKEKMIENCKNDINSLAKSKQFQTEIEMKDTDRMINDANLKINKFQTEIEKGKLDIVELQKRIIKTNEQMELYK